MSKTKSANTKFKHRKWLRPDFQWPEGVSKSEKEGIPFMSPEIADSLMNRIAVNNELRAKLREAESKLNKYKAAMPTKNTVNEMIELLSNLLTNNSMSSEKSRTLSRIRIMLIELRDEL